jgi:hypothetical protein
MATDFPYDLPIWRRSYRATSPDGDWVAEIDMAHEVSMGNPTRGTLILRHAEGDDAGLVLRLDGCNPSFVWSDDSRYLAVPRYFYRWGLFRRQRIVVIDVAARRLFETSDATYYFQPESFSSGTLVAARNPHAEKVQKRWTVPDALRVHRHASSAVWSPDA